MLLFKVDGACMSTSLPAGSHYQPTPPLVAHSPQLEHEEEEEEEANEELAPLLDVNEGLGVETEGQEVDQREREERQEEGEEEDGGGAQDPLQRYEVGVLRACGLTSLSSSWQPACGARRGCLLPACLPASSLGAIFQTPFLQRKNAALPPAGTTPKLGGRAAHRSAFPHNCPS